MTSFFEKILKPYIAENKYKSLCEIGASKGANTNKLLQVNGISVSVIDPCLDENLCDKYKNDKRVKVFKGLSLDILPNISERFDCIFIDADHNWYSVFNELKTIEKKNALKEDGTIFLHDVYWPYGRRDMYYMPETIPEQFRKPYEKKGMVRGKSELVDEGGLNPSVYNAVFEGGPRNGVLTAIEDFLKTCDGKYMFFYFKIGRGLGVLVKKKNVKTKIMFVKWYCVIKLYEILARIVAFIKRRFPVLYLQCAKIAKIFSVKL